MVVATRTGREEALWLSATQVSGSAMVKGSIAAKVVVLALPMDE